MTFSYDQIHLPPLSNLVFTLSLYMELQMQLQLQESLIFV
jgi:hypothetical protein